MTVTPVESTNDPKENAYMFSGWLNQYAQGHFVDSCGSVILYGADEDAAWKAFERWLLGEEETRTPKKILGMCGAPVLGQLLTEAGPVPIDWDKTATEAHDSASASEGGLDEGFWLDCNPYVQPEKLGSDIGQLQQNVPEDIRSGLNWSPEKVYYFLVSVLEVQSAQDSVPGQEAEGDEQDLEKLDSEATLESSAECPFPELAKKRLVVLARARNSLTAAWLWKQYALKTPLAAHPIRIDPWCGAHSLKADAGLDPRQGGNDQQA